MSSLVSTTTLQGAPLSGPLLREKALQLFAKVYPEKKEDSFKASSGWLQKFCCTHGIRAMSLQGESLSADVSCVADFRSELLDKIEKEGYTLNQICDRICENRPNRRPTYL